MGLLYVAGTCYLRLVEGETNNTKLSEKFSHKSNQVRGAEVVVAATEKVKKSCGAARVYISQVSSSV